MEIIDRERELIFISHANPEDNEFTRWLASRLSSLGYLVWSDVTQLFGAEKFWRDIEDAIRSHAAKVVVVLSRSSQAKDGVMNEVHTALAVEKKYQWNRFVIPIRIDDLPSTDITSVLIQKGYVDFHEKWADGLTKLLALFQKEGVPRRSSQTAREISRWLGQVVAGTQQIVQQPQKVLSNWFSFSPLPQNLNFFRVPIPENKISSHFGAFGFPIYSYCDTIATFASLDDINSFLPSWQIATHAYEIPLKAILNGEPLQWERLNWQDASRILTYLIRSAWDNTMLAKGLSAYLLSNGRKAWYQHDGYSEKNCTYFADMDGVERWRKLVGYSKKRRVYWHLAVEAQPVISREPLLMLKPHVAFSEDGKRLINSDRKMHSLRRSYCRSWWNDRWRDLLMAYTASIADDAGKIYLVVGSTATIQVDPRPLLFESPVSLFGNKLATETEDMNDDALDQLAEQSSEIEDELEDEMVQEDNGSLDSSR